MLILQNVRVPLEADFENLKPYAAAALKSKEEAVVSATLYRKSMDARRKNDLHFCCSILVQVKGNEKAFLKKSKNASLFLPDFYQFPKSKISSAHRPVVVGFGPAGLFAALTLARAGLSPLILERGADADTRTADVTRFFKGGACNPESNVQFGEGGAGTFSDGKLNTGIKDRRCRAVLETFVRHGAPISILTDAKPHIGTDLLEGVVKSIRQEIQQLGGEVRFHQKAEDIVFSQSAVCAVQTAEGKIDCDRLILAIGHSARDTFFMLQNRGFLMVRKPFSVGVRIEHLQADLNRALYGSFAGHPALPAADYKLVAHLANGRSVYTFCMCPGGEVVNASSELGGIAVNGMSCYARDGKNANSAVLAEVMPHDLLGEDPLEGCRFQRRIEQAAFAAAGGAVPITTVGKFVFDRRFELNRVMPTVKPKTAYADFSKLFPHFITESLQEGIRLFDEKISGFADPDAVLTAPETRSSSPVRIVRDETGQSIGKTGVFPCGEGAGYAGGIMSAATDGIKTAEAVVASLDLQ